MYLSFTPKFLQQLLPGLIWRMESVEKKVYLTFDDGPIPEVTPWVLDELDKYGAKATFFCVGQNVEKYGDIFHQLKSQGHTIGSHTYNHISGWASDNLDYMLNVRKASKICESNIFRPPYGKIRPSQTRFLKHHYRIVMWDVLSGDFDPNISAEQCLQNVLKNTIAGSIVVFHDSIKSFEKLKFVLPRVLNYYSEQGYQFVNLDELSGKSPVNRLVGVNS
ncbi:MAG: polysaccharide deacetylase family protein [Saprospiraceae bacterium]|nr:polysaccharide deacetylase family protein [Candidatus Vicinibacter proximus]MBL7823292.1 polysaccharide deacetylase family protein [Saprospiraceae bacterium]MCC6843741.1 polysaccharide deacetylase family protein [Saprospiraceae bacterium]